MAYTPTTWTTGDTITATKLNKMEQGIASGGDVAAVTLDFTGDTGASTEIMIAYCVEETHNSITHLAMKHISEDGIFITGGMLKSLCVPIPAAITSNYHVCLCIEDHRVNFQDVEVDGSITRHAKTAHYVENGSWNSLSFAAYIINGSGTITVSDNE